MWAVLPVDYTVPPHAACDWCCDPDAEPMVGLWRPADNSGSPSWATLGAQIGRRKAEDARAEALAKALLG